MIWKVPRLWEGGRCFIIGGGMSMPKQFSVPDELIQQVCKEKQSPSAYSPYMKSIQNEHVIGINDAYRLGNWVDILFFGDYQWYLSNRSALSKWSGLIVTCAENFVNKPKEDMEGVKCLARDRNHRYGISPDPTKVSWNGNSGAAAISLALHLGVKTIYLLGFDMCLVGKQSHWHNIPKSVHPVRKNISSIPPFDKHLIGFPQIAKDAKQMGVDIINLSPISKIEQFPKMRMKDVLSADLEVLNVEKGKVIDSRKKKITCITPTGDRTETFRLTKEWMKTQTIQPDQWLVVDDGQTPLPEELKQGLDYIRRIPSAGEGYTLVANMKAALPHIKGDVILIIEDDDWYGPQYIETMQDYLQTYDLVGEGCARYYHLPSHRYARLSSRGHASLAQTGFNKVLLPTFEKVLNGSPFIDIRFWKACAGMNSFLFCNDEDKLQMHCSLKGLPGRSGIGIGHDMNMRHYKNDEAYSILKKWVGIENAQRYINFCIRKEK